MTETALHRNNSTGPTLKPTTQQTPALQQTMTKSGSNLAETAFHPDDLTEPTQELAARQVRGLQEGLERLGGGRG